MKAAWITSSPTMKYRGVSNLTAFSPWMNLQAVVFYTRLLEPNMRVLELGAGKSTIWLGGQGLEVISYDHDEVWGDEVNGWIKEYGLSNVELIVVPDGYIDCISQYESESFDIVVVDGIDRLKCCEEVIEHGILKKGGWIIYDDIQRRYLTEEYVEAYALLDGWEHEIIGFGNHTNYDEWKQLVDAMGEVAPNVAQAPYEQTLFAQRPQH